MLLNIYALHLNKYKNSAMPEKSSGQSLCAGAFCIKLAIQEIIADLSFPLNLSPPARCQERNYRAGHEPDCGQGNILACSFPCNHHT
ncbi:hypothetical protein DU52_07545 [Methanosarcina mazei]|uniref:Uncharacterized protein n=1 Tax=Methanosarcina mazei TaxID=2209 RepID=A0A0F8FTX6_METMZ|nr:hypothetical protein DU52_07545 [Methanosarcina mazei]